MGFCSFVALYNRDDVDAIGLDDAARRLGVERRRIYDIVNVLESIGVRSCFLVLISNYLSLLWDFFLMSVCKYLEAPKEVQQIKKDV